MNEDWNTYGHIIDKHAYGGYTVRVQTVAQGEIEIFSAMTLGKIEEWLEANYPQSMQLHVQV